MQEKLTKIWKKLEPVHGIIYFVIILACCHFFWKFTVIGDETNTKVTFFGFNISAPFFVMTQHITNAVSYILDWLGYDHYVKSTTLYFENMTAISIVWACSGLKQMYIYCCLIAFYRGPWKHKLWYIPMGLSIVYLVNITRIVIIAIVAAHDNIPLAELLHNHVLKYVFYGIIFFLWLLWEEKFVKKKELR